MKKRESWGSISIILQSRTWMQHIRILDNADTKRVVELLYGTTLRSSGCTSISSTKLGNEIYKEWQKWKIHS